MSYNVRPDARADLAGGFDWITHDNPAAAQAFLDAARETFERIAQFPESGALARFKAPKLARVRFAVLSPPFQKWIVFYRITAGAVEIGRVIYGTMNWREAPKRFF